MGAAGKPVLERGGKKERRAPVAPSKLGLPKEAPKQRFRGVVEDKITLSDGREAQITRSENDLTVKVGEGGHFGSVFHYFLENRELHFNNQPADSKQRKGFEKLLADIESREKVSIENLKKGRKLDSPK
jgi:hypothetical protein